MAAGTVCSASRWSIRADRAHRLATPYGGARGHDDDHRPGAASLVLCGGGPLADVCLGVYSFRSPIFVKTTARPRSCARRYFQSHAWRVGQISPGGRPLAIVEAQIAQRMDIEKAPTVDHPRAQTSHLDATED